MSFFWDDLRLPADDLFFRLTGSFHLDRRVYLAMWQSAEGGGATGPYWTGCIKGALGALLAASLLFLGPQLIHTMFSKAIQSWVPSMFQDLHSQMHYGSTFHHNSWDKGFTTWRWWHLFNACQLTIIRATSLQGRFAVDEECGKSCWLSTATQNLTCSPCSVWALKQGFDSYP